jgi:hypothetical protein
MQIRQMTGQRMRRAAGSASAVTRPGPAGFRDATHVQGGVVGWVRQIDPSLPIY